MLSQLPGATAVVPIVTDHAVYASAATTMLHVLRRFILPALREIDDPTHAAALHDLKHYTLELQFILTQIEDVEKHRQNKSGT